MPGLNGLYYPELLEQIQTNHAEILEKYTLVRDWSVPGVRRGDYIRYFDPNGESSGFGTFNRRTIHPTHPRTKTRVSLVNPTTKKCWSVNESNFVFFQQGHKMPYYDSDISSFFLSNPEFAKAIAEAKETDGKK